MSFLNTKVSLENFSTSFFNKNDKCYTLSCEEEDIEIFKPNPDLDESDSIANKIYNNITETSSILLALNAMECLVEDEYTVNINSDTNKEEYNNTVNNKKDENDPNYAAAITNESEKTKEDKWIEYWNYIKHVFEKIHATSLLLFKKIHDFMTNDIKKIIIWYNEYGVKYRNQIINSDTDILKIKLPKISFDTFLKNVTVEKINLIKNMRNIVNKIYATLNYEVKDGDIESFLSQVSELKKMSKTFSVKEFNNILYKDVKMAEITSKQFFEKFDFSNLKNSSQFSDYLRDCESLTRITNDSINYVKKILSSNIKNEYRTKIKKIILDYETALNSFITGYVWIVSHNIRYINIAYVYAQKVVKNLPKE